MTNSSLDAAVSAVDCDSAANTATCEGAPESGITATMAPANGSHKIIQTNNAFLINVMRL
jgi:hypothetical protein